MFALAAFGSANSVAAGEQHAQGREVTFSVLLNAPLDVTIHDICCGRYGFGVATRSVRTFYGNPPIWLRIDGSVLPENAPGAVEVLKLNIVVDAATAYYKAEIGAGWRETRTGDLVALAARGLASPHMALPLTGRLPNTPVFIRLDQPVMTTISLSAWFMTAFAAMDRTDSLVKTFLTGIIFATVVFNMVVGALIRSSVFFLNAVTICALLLLALYLSGYGAAYIWAPWPLWSNQLLLLAIFGGVLAGGAFMAEFLRNQGETLHKGWPLLAPGLLATLAIMASLFVPYWLVQPVLIFLALALFAIGFSTVVTRAWNGDRRARILLFPLCLAMIPGIATLIMQRVFGVRFGLIDNNLLEGTLCLEAILFSLAIASRFRMGELENREMSLKLMRLRAEGTAKTIAAQDAERQRLAKELHDGVGQDFLVVLSSLKKLALEKDSKTWEAEIPSVTDTTTTALNELRRISKEMHPASISHLGLKMALETLFEHLETSSQIETTVTAECDESRLGMDAKLHIYRIFQECLSNISRHSGASCCTAFIKADNQHLHLGVEDDGSGLEQHRSTGQPVFGLGFISIDERIRSLGGRWKLSESKMGGVRLEAWVPLPENGKEPGQ